MKLIITLILNLCLIPILILSISGCEDTKNTTTTVENTHNSIGNVYINTNAETQ